MFSNNNIVMNIPLVMTMGYISFSSSLMFNLKNENISEFGKGTRLNFYNNLSFMANDDFCIFDIFSKNLGTSFGYKAVACTMETVATHLVILVVR